MKIARVPQPLLGRPAKTVRLLKRHAVVAIVTLLAVSTVAFWVSAQNETKQQIPDKRLTSVPGELLVRFRPTSELAKLKGKSSVSLRLVFRGKTLPIQIEDFGGSDLVEGLMLGHVSPAETLDVMLALQMRSDVVYVEPNFVRYIDAVPNDPQYVDQFALKNSAPGGAGISAESAWDTTTGNHSVVVGVIDSGIDINHLDLKDNIFINTAEIANDGVDNDNNGKVDDVNGWDFFNNDKTVFDNANDDAHGTHVAGTIGARGNNAIGIAGVNWDVQLMPLKALGPDGGSDATILQAYAYAKMMRQRGVNLRVLNNSYGNQGFSQALRDGVKELGDAGILFVAAAGNDTVNNDFIPQFPASFDLPNVISVAASSKFGTFASEFSNKGPQSVHIAAPGDDVVSTTPHGYAGPGLLGNKTEPDGSTYSLLSGTSMASPHVSGAAALACAANPGISLEKLRASVLFSGDENGAFANVVITGARLNANKTVQAALDPDATAPAIATNFRINSQNGRRVELRWNEAGDDGTAGRASFDEVRFIDSGSGEQFRLNTSRSADPGLERTLFVSIPFKHPTGQLSLRTFDNVGNNSTATIAVNVAADVSDPYTVTLDSPSALTANNSGTALGVKADDATLDFVQIPFAFPFFGFTTTSVSVSSNGALYIPIPPEFPNPHPNVGTTDAAVATTSNLESLAMVAGMWSDLRTDRNATDNVYMVKPDLDTVIFRWQAVTFGSETPANFEIELKRNGTIRTRYGNGNQNLLPVVVGISGGDPASYIVPTHTSEASPLSLSNAQGVTFAPKNPPPTPTADLAVTMSASPNPLLSGQSVTYNVSINNLGPSLTEEVVMTDVLPAGAAFVSCTSENIFATCSNSNGTITGRLPSLGTNSGVTFRIVATVTGPPGTLLQNTASVTAFRLDPNLANNSATNTTSIVAESFFSSVKAISAGRFHTTSVRNDGTVWNWGMGGNGQLGDGNSGIGVRSVTPIQVSGLEGVTAVADGNVFALALKSDGTVWGWGINNSGQLGDGTTVDRSRPVQTIGLSNVTAIAAGMFYSAALKSDGTVWLWGNCGGLGSTVSVVRTTPVQLTGISNVTAISAGGGHLLMLKNDKTLWAAGNNSRGQLGDGTTTLRPFPVQVNNLTNVSRIAAAGDEFSGAVKEDGTVWAWGINFNGQLGPGGGSMNFDAHPNPIQVTGLPGGISNIVAGQDWFMSLASDGTVWSWGSDGAGQLGSGSGIGQNPTPHQIANFNGVSALSAGINHSVALKTDGSVWTWGGNSEGQLGDGSTTMRFFPVRVSGLETVSSPSLNPAGGNFIGPVGVTVTCATPGATIHFTINGNDPTESDPVVTSGDTIQINTALFFKARAWKPGLIPSSISFGNFNLNGTNNPIDGSQFFARQHYLDFLGRQPDTSGLNFWTNNIGVCGFDQQCLAVKRIDTSAAFFLSIEFQQTGYLVFRIYKTAFGNLPLKPVPITLQQFTPDVAQLGQNVIVGQGNWQAQLEQNKQTYANQFVLRPEFVQKYPASQSPLEFVNALNTTAGNVLTQTERDSLVAELTAGTKGRGDVLRAIAEGQVVTEREFNSAFVLMQYFGYLRRNPDSAPDTNFDGYNFWLGKLNQFNGDFRAAEMVKAFIVSGEYRQRFGP